MIDSQEALARLLDDVKRHALDCEDRTTAAAQLLEAAESLLVAAGEIGAEVLDGDGAANGYLAPEMQQRAAHRVYGARRVRDAVFADATLFGEPAWDMLLDLLAAQGSKKRISVTSACLASNVPLTTALRWITVLEGKGLVEREEDEMDARRTFLKLTRKARGLLRTYFVELERRKLL
ncbi:winged helix DNA-binding protein [Novosphingobium sp. JCM 18896]|uniref:winged helix DNA-binding protein n=1 Tax=Novosphingobium sp. JCM 18896 TaxID=2989731 RepID=UPI002221D6A5|nr:winged helix DNA-binding protein [Novosphingobium sp. JCM 18896]MCW1429932.1 winged helix DNA-binding protein [Novosphingobium sp. JCM 18896]